MNTPIPPLISPSETYASLSTSLLNITGKTQLNDNVISGSGSPTNDTDLVNKSYVDNIGIYSPFPNSTNDIITFTAATITPFTFNVIRPIAGISLAPNGTFTCNVESYYMITFGTIFIPNPPATSSLVIRDMPSGNVLGAVQAKTLISLGYTGTILLTEGQTFRIDLNLSSTEDVVGPLSFGPQLNLTIKPVG